MMQRFSNRVTFESFVRAVTFDETTVALETDNGSFVVPANTLTLKIDADPQFPYKFEVDESTKILCGIISPEGSTLYRINNDQVRQVSQSPEFLSRLAYRGNPLNINEVLPTMMEQIDEVYIDRLRNLPEDYLNQFYVYEVKVSYLASDSEKTVMFDPTPTESAHALALALSQSPTYPPFILKTY